MFEEKTSHPIRQFSRLHKKRYDSKTLRTDLSKKKRIYRNKDGTPKLDDEHLD